MPPKRTRYGPLRPRGSREGRLQYLEPALAVSKDLVSRLISTLVGILFGLMILISLQNDCLLSPPE